ncbi:MAG: hypothetical protein A2283_13545 [Lentisphaerae bacterium RIFOXYA12_FULL_48_11]|nr:MAG: hypothetical protein A2283_13545 [Lentisphaerae bacterium RIFOXYA12_FULL_48_11]
MKKSDIQYTIRAVPEDVDDALRKNSVREGCSLNNYVIDTLRKGAGLSDTQLFHDLDFLSGKWIKDEVCENALEEFNRIDEGMWK